MTYTNTEPSATQLISVGQGTILANFQAIDSGSTGSSTTGGSGSGFSVNHITMTSDTYPGMHDMLDFPDVQTEDPTPTGDDYAGIYTKTGTTYAEPFFINNSVSASVIWYGGTGTGGVTPTSASSSSNYLDLPNGIQFRWGTGTVASSSAASEITFSPVFSNGCINVQVTAKGTSNALLALVDTNTPPTASAFYARGANTPTNFYYFAVGY